MEIKKWRYVKGRYRRFETLFLGRIKAFRDGHMMVYRSNKDYSKNALMWLKGSCRNCKELMYKKIR
jgi:hypothetical protein